MKLYTIFDKLTEEQMHQIKQVTIKRLNQVDDVPTTDIIYMRLIADQQCAPKMLVLHQNDQQITAYHFPLTQGFQIHCCNEYLRALDTGMDIHFNTYKQYGCLINACMRAITQ